MTCKVDHSLENWKPLLADATPEQVDALVAGQAATRDQMLEADRVEEAYWYNYRIGMIRQLTGAK